MLIWVRSIIREGSNIAGEAAQQIQRVSPRQGAGLVEPPLCVPNKDIPIPPASLKGSGPGCPLLRASNEHIPIVRVLRARRAPGRSLPRP